MTVHGTDTMRPTFYRCLECRCTFKQWNCWCPDCDKLMYYDNDATGKCNVIRVYQ